MIGITLSPNLSPSGGGVLLLRRFAQQFDGFDAAHPVVVAAVLRREVAEQGEDMVAEAADVEDVRTVSGLNGCIRLDVDADEFGLRAALFQGVPFSEQGAFVAVHLIRPRFVVRDDDDHVNARFFVVEQA